MTFPHPTFMPDEAGNITTAVSLGGGFSGSNANFHQFTATGDVTDEYVIVALAAQDQEDQAVDNLLVDGNSCSLMFATHGCDVEELPQLGFYITDAPATFTTSALMRVNWLNSKCERAAMLGWRITTDGTLDTTPKATGEDTDNSNPLQVILPGGAGKCILAVCMNYGNEGLTFDWTDSTSPIVEVAETGSMDNRTAGFAEGDLIAGGNYTVDVEQSGSSTDFSLCAIVIQ